MERRIPGNSAQVRQPGREQKRDFCVRGKYKYREG